MSAVTIVLLWIGLALFLIVLGLYCVSFEYFSTFGKPVSFFATICDEDTELGSRLDLGVFSVRWGESSEFDYGPFDSEEHALSEMEKEITLDDELIGDLDGTLIAVGNCYPLRLECVRLEGHDYPTLLEAYSVRFYRYCAKGQKWVLSGKAALKGLRAEKLEVLRQAQDDRGGAK